MVHGQLDQDIPLRSFRHQLLRDADFIHFHERLARLESLGSKKCVCHGAANQNRVGHVDEVLDQLNLIGNLRASDDGDIRPFCFRQRVTECFDLLLH